MRMRNLKTKNLNKKTSNKLSTKSAMMMTISLAQKIGKTSVPPGETLLDQAR
jgi:hypothetical protein